MEDVLLHTVQLDDQPMVRMPRSRQRLRDVRHKCVETAHMTVAPED